MTFFFQAFFFVFFRKTPKRGSYPHFKASFRAVPGAPSPPRYKMAKFDKFQGFNIFENKINPTYQQIIHLDETGPHRGAASARLFCNFNFTFKNFTLVYNLGSAKCEREHKRNAVFCFDDFLHRICASLNYLCLGDVLGIQRKEL